MNELSSLSSTIPTYIESNPIPHETKKNVS